MSIENAAALVSDEPVADDEVASTETTVRDQSQADDSPAETTEATDDASGGGADPDDASGVDEELRGYAQLYGLDTTDPKEIVKYLSAELDRSVINQGRQTHAPQQETPAQKQEAAKIAALELAKLLPPELPKGEWDETIIARDKQYQDAFKALHDHYEARFAAMSEPSQQMAQRLDAMEQFYARQEATRIDREIDGFFDGLGAEWSGTFGKGRPKSEHSQHFKARNEVIEQAVLLRDGYAARGINPPDVPTLLKRALHSLHADKATTTARKQVASQLAANKNRALGTPRRKTDKPQDPEARAKAALVEAMRRNGFNTAKYEDDDE